MRLLRSLVLLAAAGLSVAGCSQPRPKPILGCNYQVVPLTVGPRWRQAPLRLDAVAGAASVQDGTSARLGALLSERRRIRQPLLGAEAAKGEPASDQFLALSGGGQHGAFGAGFFYGMAKLPSWDIVTGVSTGSLQSTLLFLANQPVPADRTDYSWVDGPMSGQDGATGLVVKPGTSNVGDLVLAYSIAEEADLMRKRAGGAAMGVVLKGSTASFGPLRARLLKVMTPGTLRAVGREWRDQKRQLFVGVSNLDDGEGYGIDMTELAARALDTDSPAELARLQGCYVDAMLASSSVPPGVPPITLQTAKATQMYMDGGARFGMFLEPVMAAIKGAGGEGRGHIMLMVNTTMDVGSWSGTGQPMQRWSAVTAALRAVDLMETQVYRFSAASVEQLGIAKGGLDMAFLSNADIPGGERPDDHVFNGKTCAAWQAIDAKAKPLQFYPWYMACTADYGRSRGAAQQWNHSVAR
ncbi:patatin-like phospholipase family protein [Sphingomonas sp. HT-1]|uniref:patatin-like phospholipase family protein n=1 Tax=unclassified Sphingomonas TaxID=196159 RepID=UPI001EEFF358|nr:MULTISPECIES: patatin-like phospholipase family protein [unclassified Sphingomonas]